MESSSKRYEGVVDKSQNPFACDFWIEQGYPLTRHRHDQVERLLSKTVEEIRAIDKRDGPTRGSYPAFVAIRWGYAEIKNNRLVPTRKWMTWRLPDRKGNGPHR